FLLVCFRKFIAKLPDKGKKISDFAEKLKLAIFQEEEVARTAELLSAVRLEFRAKQEEINTSKQEAILTEDTVNSVDSTVFNENSNIKDNIEDIAAERHEAECIEEDATNTALENQMTQRKNEVKTVTKDQNSFCEAISKSSTSNHLNNDQQVSQSNSKDGTESTADLDSSKEALVD
ncbi:GRL1A polymerase, partial [Cinclus mexicanus]|nr:GRL1A polymerase [Cinclus mexicanus]